MPSPAIELPYRHELARNAVARVAVIDGRHELTGSAPFGVTLVGWGTYSSYAMPGGMRQALLDSVAAVPGLGSAALVLLTVLIVCAAVTLLNRERTSQPDTT